MGELEQEEQQKCQLLTSPEKTQRHMPLQWWVNIILFLHKETFLGQLSNRNRLSIVWLIK